MLKSRWFWIGVISLVFTLMTPFIFKAYFEKKPVQITENVRFGVPFPFVEQTVQFPTKAKDYPVEIKFQSPIKKDTSFKLMPFLFSFLGVYLLFFTFYTVLIRFFFSSSIRKNEHE